MDDYHGWSNYQTWSVAIWLQSNPTLYAWMKGAVNYGQLRRKLRSIGMKKTPDGVDLDDDRINLHEINVMIRES